jgi:hypothetical protein
MSTLDYILDKYDLRGKESPISLFCSRWRTIPRLFKKLGFTLGAEIGVFKGYFSKYLIKDNPNLKLYAVDNWIAYGDPTADFSQRKMDQYFLESKALLKPFNCEIIKAWSMDAVKKFEDESLDFVYIDANHDYKYVKEDIREWSKKVRKGGIVCGHDYIEGCFEGGYNLHFGVIQAVNEHVAENNIKHLFVLNKEKVPSWMYVKDADV